VPRGGAEEIVRNYWAEVEAKKERRRSALSAKSTSAEPERSQPTILRKNISGPAKRPSSTSPKKRRLRDSSEEPDKREKAETTEDDAAEESVEVEEEEVNGLPLSKNLKLFAKSKSWEVCDRFLL
jgi:hypothetical protein